MKPLANRPGLLGNLSMRKTLTAILISGRGSNMVSLVKASRHRDYPADISLVISNNPDAPGLAKARELGVMAMSINYKNFKNRLSFDMALDSVLQAAQIEMVCCAGFMRILTPEFTSRWQGKLLNIHPSLLPKYKGLNTHQKALDAGDKEHGCTVHYVTPELDSGEIILQHKIKVLNTDTADSLAARLLPLEQKLYPIALKKALAEVSG